MKSLIDNFDGADEPVLSLVWVTSVNDNSVEGNLLFGTGGGFSELGVVHLASFLYVELRYLQQQKYQRIKYLELQKIMFSSNQ